MYNSTPSCSTCGCGCWGILLGIFAFLIALLAGAVAIKAFEIALIVFLLCTFVGLGMDALVMAQTM